ncbi:MarR family winged helix-turn-helix transcriptional regulator [Enterococcus sp. LJL90]
MSKLTNQLMKQLRFVGLASNQFVSLKEENLSGQKRVLQILSEEDGLVQSQLAEILDIRPSSLAEVLKKMETAGDIYRQEDEQDKRIKRVYLSEVGRKKATALTNGKNRSEAFFKGLNEAEQLEFQELLEKIPEGWEEEFQRDAPRFMDPLDRLQMMQNFRQQFEDQWGQDWDQLSPEEFRKLRKNMRREMKQQAFQHRREMKDFGRNFGRQFPGNFWGNPEDWQEYADLSDKKKPAEKDSEDEWQDF